MTENRQKWLTLAAMVSVGALVADRVVLAPLTSHWESQSERILELRKSLERGTVLLDRAETLRERWAEMQEDAIPADISDAESEVLRAASRWARESRILLTGLVPQWRKHKANFETLECRVSAEGNLDALTRFLLELETDPLAVRLEACEITPIDDNGRQLSLSIRFSALRLPEPEQPRS